MPYASFPPWEVHDSLAGARPRSLVNLALLFEVVFRAAVAFSKEARKRQLYTWHTFGNPVVLGLRAITGYLLAIHSLTLTLNGFHLSGLRGRRKQIRTPSYLSIMAFPQIPISPPSLVFKYLQSESMPPSRTVAFHPAIIVLPLVFGFSSAPNLRTSGMFGLQ
jgi:hypothetical protein